MIVSLHSVLKRLGILEAIGPQLPKVRNTMRGGRLSKARRPRKILFFVSFVLDLFLIFFFDQ